MNVKLYVPKDWIEIEQNEVRLISNLFNKVDQPENVNVKSCVPQDPDQNSSERSTDYYKPFKSAKRSNYNVSIYQRKPDQPENVNGVSNLPYENKKKIEKIIFRSLMRIGLGENRNCNG